MFSPLGYAACVLYDEILSPYLVPFVDLKQLYIYYYCVVCVCFWERLSACKPYSMQVCQRTTLGSWFFSSPGGSVVKFRDMFRFALCAQRDFYHWIIPHVPFMFLNPDISESSPININSSQQYKLSSLGAVRKYFWNTFIQSLLSVSLHHGESLFLVLAHTHMYIHTHTYIQGMKGET